MKKLTLILLLIGSVSSAIAQNLNTAVAIGATVDNKEVEVNGEKMYFGAISGNTIISTNAVIVEESATDEGAAVMAGFPFLVPYFPQVFDVNFFASKGYFGNLVQLQWDANSDEIDQFRIYRKPLAEEGDSILVAVLGQDDFFFKDETIDFGVVYKYTIFARGLADDLRVKYFNYIEGDGFAFPTGSVSGQVLFDGGSAVKDVSVVATTEGNLSGKSIEFDGDNQFLKVVHGTNDDELQLNDGFTTQMWVKYKADNEAIIFKKGDDYQLTYDGAQFKFDVGGEELQMNFANPVDSFFHVSAIYAKGDSLALSVTVSDSRTAKKSQASSATLDTNFDNFIFGGNGTSTGQLKGNLDEIRVWSKPLTASEVENNYNRYISGNENDLVAYWRLDMGISNDFYDFSRKGATFYENHGEVVGAKSSEDVPLNSQLSFRGLTDQEGNYTITGFPYESTGSLYKFTALKTYHEFDPPQQTRFVGPSESIHNEIDFTDISSFEVSGEVYYRNSTFPVEGVSILIDGQVAFDSEGQVITTDANGEFKVAVPIGEHSLRMSMANHEFEFNGRFPKPTDDDQTPLFNFQEPISGLEFTDETVVKMTGRVVGGPVEEAKLLGFSKSKNNIGHAEIILKPQKENGDLAKSDSTKIYVEANAGEDLNSEVKFNTNSRQISIKPDQETGEYVAYLPPEKYTIESITAGTDTKKYTFGESFKVTVDLTQSFTNEYEVLTDTVPTSVNGNQVDGVLPVNNDDYDYTETFTRNDTLFTVAIDSFRVQKRQDFIYRRRPTVDVVNANGSGFFGDATYNYTDDALGIDEDIQLYNESTDIYTFGRPIFTQREVYQFDIQLFEEYTNYNTDAIDRVPVVDGKVEIVNELSLSSAKVVLELDENGKTKYGFRAGMPNRSLDALVPANSFTKPLSITAFSGNNGAIQTVWREDDPFRGIIFGSQPFGNNFVTTGPNIVDYILRDPPGSQSTASIGKGETITSSSSFSITDKSTDSQNMSISLGLGVTTFVGLGAGVINEVDDQASAEAGFSLSSEYTEATEKEETITIDRTISTSDDPLLVGDVADVFIGRSTNIVYGAAGFVELIPASDCTTCGNVESEGYRIGTRTGMNFGSQFSTGFAFSQLYIEETLVPNLKKIRNSLLTYSATPDDITATDQLVYISRIPISDPNFGKSNTDEEVWGDQASAFTNDGPSYVIKVPNAYIGKLSDTINFYNKQISSWEFWLAENEKQKVQATLDDNVSFESGATYQQSVTVQKTESTTLSTDFTVDTSVGATLGITVNDVGFSATTSLDISSSTSKTKTDTESRSTTSSFTLADGDVGDAFTIDVKTPKDGFGTIFSTRGGQTACPYEPESITKYFEPGKHVLHAATQRREGPVISAQQAVIANIPENRPANFTINLTTDSETDEAFFYTLLVDPESNPNGAELSINGDAIGNGLSFLVKPGETLTQTVSLRKGREDVFNYEDIRLLLVSQCQFDPDESRADLADTARISAFFVPGCSEIEISSPGDNWVLNTNAAQEDILSVNIGGYNLNLSDFTRFAFQYRAVGSSTWITDMTFYNSLNVTQAEFDALTDSRKQRISDPNIVYAFDMGDLPDQEYEIRAMAYCDVGGGVSYETPSEILRGIKDTQRPQAFGAPQPADGILSANDEIKIRFNEEIVGGKLNLSNFSVKGVLNNAPVRNSVSVNLDGVDNYVRIEEGLRLGETSFTVEFKLKRSSVNEEVIIFSKGYDADNQLEIGFTVDNKLFVQYGSQRVESSLTVTDVVNFNHYAISYNADENELYAYVNDKFYIEQVALNHSINGTGPISLGRSNITNDKYVEGNLLDLRIWNRFKSLADINASAYAKLNSIEIGLVGYWPFDEAYGNVSVDRARFRNATLFAEWSVLPKGAAYAFDGIDDYLSINTASTVVIGKENDFTIEMWLNGSEQTNAVLFSSGRGTSGTEVTNQFEDPAKSLSLGFNAKGELYLASNGQTNILLSSTEDLLDNDWHHLAVSVSRLGSSIVYVDGEQVGSFSSDDIGGFIRSQMTIGARSTRVDLNNESRDRFFKGKIDDFRIWAAARSGTHIQLDRNARLTGEEFGLVAYYPFEEYQESQGIQQLDQTLDDQYVNNNGNNGGTATSNGGADFTDNTPNITLSRPLKDVAFTYLVNDDELIITPNPNAQAAIERSVLEISVEKVEDVNGNRLASPIIFTAFVNRNLVKWGEDNIEIEKSPEESFSFEMDVTNLGGSEEKFNISNLPAWLVAEPQSGTLSPQSSQSITFTVNAGLNNGYYNEDIFLSTDFGFNEKLNIDLKVLEPSPEWAVDPKDFEFSMSIVAQLSVNNIVSRDPNDLIAAFIDNEIRGLAQLKYVRELDQYLAFIDVYNNAASSSSNIEFRAFDADQGIEYRKLEPLKSTFESNKVIGRPSNPEVLETGNLRAESYQIEPGFSWLSFNLNSTQLDSSNDLFANVEAETNDRITTADFIDVYTEGLGWLGTITSNGGFNTDDYYLLSLQNGGEIELVGTKVDPDTELTIEPGFNRIGFIPDFNLSVDEAFAPLSPKDGDIIRSQLAFAIYEEGIGWIGSLENLEPQKGYLYYSNAQNSKAFSYPKGTFLSGPSSTANPTDFSDNDKERADFSLPWSLDAHKHPVNMSMVIDLDVELPDDFALAAFNQNDELLGVALRNREENGLFYLTVHGDYEESIVYFRAFDKSTGKQYLVNENHTYTPFALRGSSSKPEILTVQESFDLSASSLAYPNPFTNELVIELAYPTKEVSYEIYNSQGALVESISLSDDKKIRKIYWNGTSSSGQAVQAGMFLFKIRQSEKVETIKVIKQ